MKRGVGEGKMYNGMWVSKRKNPTRGANGKIDRPKIKI